MKKNLIFEIKIILFSAIVFCAFLLFFGEPSLAQSPTIIRIAPLSFDLKADPGEEKTGKLYLENLSDKNLKVETEFSDFFIDNAGKYIFSDNRQIENQELRPYLMKDWFSASENNFEIGKGEGKTIEYKIHVPESASLGGHYGAIFFRTTCDIQNDSNVVATDKSSLCVSGRVGTLFLLQVGGEVQKKGKIEKVQLPRISADDKARMSLVIKNIGNTHFKPTGEIVEKNLFGQKVGRIEIGDKTLLPTTSFDFSSEISRQDLLGFYVIDGQIKDGDGNVMNFKKYLFLPPWKEVLLAIVLVAALFWFSKKYSLKKKKK